MKKTPRPLVVCLAVVATAAACKFIAKQIVSYRDAWTNGLTKREGPLENGLQTGDWTFYYESGARRARGRYENDHQVGPWTYYYETGVAEWSGAFDASGKRTGEWTFHHPDETMRARGTYLEDFEDGPWEFFAPDGSPERAGQFDAGKLSGLWKYHYPGGKPKAEGLCFRGQRIGPWKVWDEAGQLRTQDFGSKPGIQVVLEVWPNGAQKRAGVLQDGKPAGRWGLWHEDGKPRLLCGFRDGRAHGVFEARDAAGQVLAQGVLAAGAFTAGGTAREKGQSRPIVAGPVPAPAAAPTAWATAEVLASQAPESALGLLLAEATMPAEPAAVVAAAKDPAPAPAAVAAVVAQIASEPERVPAPVQPDLTVTQREEIDGYVLNYLDGPSKARVSRRSYGPAGGGEVKKTGTRRRTELEGKPMPATLFRGVDGKDLDITQYQGKKSLLVVVLRGFLGEVCVYCVAQTEALAQCRERLEALGIEVLVVYPGARENEESFEKAYEMTFGKGAPPYRVFYDPDLELVGKLGIAGDLAYPTTIIVDKQGIVQYAYVGEHRADRPAAKQLIKLIEDMK